MLKSSSSSSSSLVIRLLPWALIAALAASGVWLRAEALKKQSGLHYDGILYSALGERLRRDPLDYDPRNVVPHLQKIFPNDPVPTYLDRPIFKHPPVFPVIISFFEPNIRASSAAAGAAGAVLLMALPAAAVAAVPVSAAWAAAAALSVLAVDPAHWTLSAQGLMSTTLALFMFLGLAFFVLGQRRPVFFAASGVFCGLAVMTHYSGALAGAGILLYTMLYDRARTASAAFWALPALAAAVTLPWFVMNRAVYGPEFLLRMADAHGSGLNREMLAWTLAAAAAMTAVLVLTAVYQLGKPAREGFKLLTAAGRAASWLPAIAAAAIFGTLLVQGDLITAAAKGFGWTDLPDRYAAGKTIHTAPWGFYFLRLLELSPFYAAAFIGLVICLWKKTLAPSLVPFAVTALLILGWFTLYSEFETRYILPAVPFLAMLAGWVFAEGWKRFGWLSAAVFVYCLLKTLQAGSWLTTGRTVFF